MELSKINDKQIACRLTQQEIKKYITGKSVQEKQRNLDKLFYEIEQNAFYELKFDIRDGFYKACLPEKKYRVPILIISKTQKPHNIISFQDWKQKH